MNALNTRKQKKKGRKTKDKTKKNNSITKRKYKEGENKKHPK